jgi:glucose-1-phosphate adenylyltransferase
MSGDPSTNLYTVQGDNRIYSEDMHSAPQYIGPKATVKDSLVNQGAVVLGSLDHCVVSGDTLIEEGASCVNDVIMAGAIIKKGAIVEDAIIGPNSLVDENEKINTEHDGIALFVNGKAGK